MQGAPADVMWLLVRIVIAISPESSPRSGWKDGKKPEKIVLPRYDGLNSYKPDPSHI